MLNIQHESQAQFQIQAASIEDADIVNQIIHEAFEQYRGKLDPPSGAHAEKLETIRRLLNTETCLLARVTGEPDSLHVGCVFCTPHPQHQDELYLHRLAVLPAYRKLGIGSVLVQSVEEIARARDFDFVSLGVRVALPDNRRYYERLGYTITSYAAHPGKVAATYMIMRKRVGEPLPRAVVIEPWSPAWADQYARAAQQLQGILQDGLLAIYHIGSTSVEGLAAKPIIDLLGISRDLAETDARDFYMLAAGWRPRGEYGFPGRRLYVKGPENKATHHFHLWQQGHPEIERHLALPRYLRAHPEEAARYAARKAELARQHPWEIQAYISGKDALVKQLEARALAWSRALPATDGLPIDPSGNLAGDGSMPASVDE